MTRSAWPSVASIVDLAFEARERRTFRPALMQLLMKAGGADLALLTEIAQPPEEGNAVHLPLDMLEGAREEFTRMPTELRPVRAALQRTRVVRDFGFPSRRHWHSTQMFQRYHRPLGVTAAVGALLPGAAPRHICIIRAGGRPFDEDAERKLSPIVRAIALADASVCAAPPLPPPLPAASDTLVLPRMLTARQEEICADVLQGFTNFQIARRRGISVHTVRNHLVQIFERVGVSSRAELVRRLSRRPRP